MGRSQSTGNQIHRQELAIAGAVQYSKELPAETATTATALKHQAIQVRELAATQERAKQDLVMATQKLNAGLAEGNRLTAKIVRLAEATWGPRHPRLREFRPATEGRATKRAFTRQKSTEQPPAPEPVAITHR